MSTLRSLAPRLRRLRLRHQLTQEEFAETIGLNYKFYQQIEAGRKKQIWLETVERLAAGFGVEVWQLLAPDDPAQTTVPMRSGGERQKAVAEAAADYAGKPGATRKRARRRG